MAQGQVGRGPARRAATLATSVATALFAAAHEAITALLVASLIAGASWIAAVSNLNVSAQVALPEWVRGRGLAVYVTVMFGTLPSGARFGARSPPWPVTRFSADCSRGRCDRDPADLAMEAADGRERRLFALDALA